MPNDLPPKLCRQVRAIERALEAIVAGDDPEEDPGETFEAALSTAYEVANVDPYGLAVEPDHVTADRMRELRVAADLTQKELADLMVTMGHTKWRRGTVTETEQYRHRLTLQELFTLAALFGVPLVELLLPQTGQVVEVSPDGTQAGSRQAAELILGRGGEAGQGGPVWSAAASVADIAGRPAHTYWKRRRAAEREGS